VALSRTSCRGFLFQCLWRRSSRQVGPSVDHCLKQLEHLQQLGLVVIVVNHPLLLIGHHLELGPVAVILLPLLEPIISHRLKLELIIEHRLELELTVAVVVRLLLIADHHLIAITAVVHLLLRELIVDHRLIATAVVHRLMRELIAADQL